MSEIFRTYRSVRTAGVGDFIASVSGSSGDYDITCDNGYTLEGYDETTKISSHTPVAGDLLVFGWMGGERKFEEANALVIDGDEAGVSIIPSDLT